MNKASAAHLLGLSGEVTPDAVKKAYRQASSKYHPDKNPAGTEMMQAINAAYEVLKNYTGSVEEKAGNYSDDMNNALTSIISLQGLEIEVCGSWVWVTGNTKEHKESLKTAGFKWAHKKKAWYFRPHDDTGVYRGNCSLDDIRERHGSQKPTPHQGNKQIAA